MSGKVLPKNGRATGSVSLQGSEILNLPVAQLNKVRGDKVGMIFQDPLTALTPHLKVGEQMAEVLKVHRGLSGRDAEKHCLDWLERVRIPEAKRRLKQYPHELSGGMRQRVMIAQAMLCEPKLLIADEPTTALDVTVQAEVLDLMDQLKRELGTAIALITHDMGVVARMCDRIKVMRLGEFVEEGEVSEIFSQPRHDYTRRLLDSMPRIDKGEAGGKVEGKEILRVDDMKVHFPIKVEGGLFGKTVPLKAVNGVSFGLRAGETLGIVGESGCGKSTLARAVLRLVDPTGGNVSWLGKPLHAMDKQALKTERKDLQIVFQDPLASLDPRMTIADSIAEPLKTYRPELTKSERRDEVLRMMTRVGLEPEKYNRYPHELSGGQNQRVGEGAFKYLRRECQRRFFILCDLPEGAALPGAGRAGIQGLEPRSRSSQMSKLVTIFGGSGFVGRYIARRMAKLGWRVRVAVRHPNEALFVKPYGSVGQVEPVFCNIRDDASVRAVMQGADAVVNCVGTFDARGKNSFDAVQVEGAERIARIAAEQGAEALVHISAIGADTESRSGYARSRALGWASCRSRRTRRGSRRWSARRGPR